MRYLETAEASIELEIAELDPSIWPGLDLWLAEWKEEV